MHPMCGLAAIASLIAVFIALAGTLLLVAIAVVVAIAALVATAVVASRFHRLTRILQLRAGRENIQRAALEACKAIDLASESYVTEVEHLFDDP